MHRPAAGAFSSGRAEIPRSRRWPTPPNNALRVTSRKKTRTTSIPPTFREAGVRTVTKSQRRSAPTRRGAATARRTTRAAQAYSRHSRPLVDRHRRLLARPRAIWTLHQGAVVVLRLPGDLRANPGRQFDVLMLVAQLDFGDDQAEVVAGENVDFPGEVAARNDVAHLIDDGALAELYQRLGFQYRNIILQLQPAQVRGPRFDGQRCGAIVADANADRCFPVAGQIGLSKGRATGGEPFPSVAAHEEFSLNLETHSPPRSGHLLQTCGFRMGPGRIDCDGLVTF